MTKQHIETMHRGGWPRIWNYDTYWRRVREAWWILTGYQSLHRAWQKGYDCHAQDESLRLSRVGPLSQERVNALKEAWKQEQQGLRSNAHPDARVLPTNPPVRPLTEGYVVKGGQNSGTPKFRRGRQLQQQFQPTQAHHG